MHRECALGTSGALMATMGDDRVSCVGACGVWADDVTKGKTNCCGRVGAAWLMDEGRLASKRHSVDIT